jgi:carbamoyl-phosphate synthase/aspartate carbamoyltransferase/dihydroorotase
MIRLPGLVDPHVHMREPGGIHKEDWDSGTAAALAGGVTQVLAMPNTHPPVVDRNSLEWTLKSASLKARCDYGQFLGAGPDNASVIPELSPRAAGLKMYLNQTFGPLCLEDMTAWMKHFACWPRQAPLAVHAEGTTMAAIMLLSAIYDRPVHLCHVSRREEVLLIRKAKEQGLRVTCEVTPHHLFLTEEDIPDLSEGISEVRPRLASEKDQAALWENLEVIDCFATDHAPHTLDEKRGPNPPPGFPGLETALPLFLTAVSEKRLSMDDLLLRMVTNPRRIFNLPVQPGTWIEIDPNASWEITASGAHTRCGWTPFESYKVRGRLLKVYLRGQLAFDAGEVLSSPGSGRNIRQYAEG